MYAIFTYIQPRSIFKHSKDMDRSMSSYHILNRTWHLFQIDEHCWGGSVYWLTIKTIKERHTVDGKNPTAVEVGSLFHYLQSFFIHPRLCGISSINSMSNVANVTLLGTNISPKNGILKMIFLFPRWDMLVPWRVIEIICMVPYHASSSTLAWWETLRLKMPIRFPTNKLRIV